jgi:hypothetical protein
MLHSFSWHSFLLIIISLAAIYYVIIFLAYYRKDAKDLLSGERFPRTNKDKVKKDHPDLFPGQVAGQISENKSEEEAQFSLAHSLGSQLKQIIQEAARNRTVKEELMTAIQLVLRKDMYQLMKGTAFSIAINNLIQYECETQCSVHLSALEVNGLWAR